MSNGDDLGTYDFLPWMRLGAAVRIARGENDPAPNPVQQRPSFSVDVVFNSGQQVVNGIQLQLYGPGDIVSLDTRVVVRTWPRPDVFEAEPNYFPFIEFDQPDLPWRYTPANSVGRGSRPWLSLIVLRETDEITGYKASTGEGKLASVTLDPTKTPLPDLGQSWAWAHVQIAGKGDDNPATILQNEPHRIISRILCPRRLDPKTPYTAFLVPAFKLGVLAGLGQPPDPSIDALAPAWTTPPKQGDPPITLPVYYQWRFQTGGAGDFDALVRRLKPNVVPSTVGIRDMDVSAADPNLPPAASTALGLEGALKATTTQSTAWNDPERTQWASALSMLLNRPDDLLRGKLLNVPKTKVVGPPLYGRWHAAQQTVQQFSWPYWFNELNIDPRWRTIAGLGTMVVQDEQQQLMASAWEQVGAIREVNAELRHSQLAREVGTRLYDRHFATASPQSLLMITAPVHGRVQIPAAVFADPAQGLAAIGGAVAQAAAQDNAPDPASVHINARTLLAVSPIGRSVFDGQFRRLSRPYGPLGRRQGLPLRRRQSTLIERLNQNDLVVVDRMPAAGRGMATMADFGRAVTSSLFDPSLMMKLAALPRRRMLIVGLVLVLAALLIAIIAKLWIIVLPLLTLGVALLGAGLVPQLGEIFQRKVALQTGRVNSDLIASFPPRPDFVLKNRPEVGDLGLPPARPRTPIGSLPPPKAVPGDNPAAQAFRQAAIEAFAGPTGAVQRPPKAVAVDIGQVRDKIMGALHPKLTIEAHVVGRLQLAASVDWKPDDPIEPVMAYPEFPQPMYSALSDLSQDWLLPGLDKIPPDTLSLLESNEEFIEAYMVGLNHEMGRELLFNEYPTDQRGSYFRQFWDPGSYIPADGPPPGPDDLKDIPPIHTWPKSSHIGDNTGRSGAAGGNYLVLLVRGELLRRYPNTIIYAAPAVWSGDKRTLSEDVKQEKYPLFHGSLKPDVVFLGFDLTAEQARGEDAPGGKPGWFFVLQEQPTEPRFGLEDLPGVEGQTVAAWPDLCWGHLVAKPDDRAKLNYIDLNAQYPQVNIKQQPDQPVVNWSGAKTTAGDLAFITFREPYRVAVHASAMLPDAKQE